MYFNKKQSEIHNKLEIGNMKIFIKNKKYR